MGQPDISSNGASAPSVAVVDGRGLSVSGLSFELNRALASGAQVVVCDLSGMAMAAGGVGELLAPMAAFLSGWPGTVVVVCSADPVVRRRLKELPAAYRLVVAVTREEGLAAADAVSPSPSPQHTALTLGPELDSPRTARAFASRALQEWQAPDMIGPTSLVIGELVTNSVVHARTSLELNLSKLDGRLLVTVSDHANGVPKKPEHLTEQGLGGRGLFLVEAFTLGWGVFPARPRGKTVWAVLDTHHPPLV